jgi:Flp pilus assembly CpaE family ATPase
MLWVDKYRPNTLAKMDFHAQLTAQLTSLVKTRKKKKKKKKKKNRSTLKHNLGESK